MGRRGPLPTPLQAYVLSLYLRGYLATLEEGALIAAVTRARIGVWLRSAGIDWRRERLNYIARQRGRALAIAEGRTPRRVTKRELRLRSDQALAEWAAKPESSA